jgi:hypothetical protein
MKPKKKSVAGLKRDERRVQQKEALLDNLRTGMSIVAACSVSGISEATYYRWLDDSGADGEWTEEVEAARNFSEAVLLQKVKDNGEARQDWRAYSWILERRFPERWGATRQVDLNVNQTHNETDAIMMSMIEQISKPYIEEEEGTDETDND